VTIATTFEQKLFKVLAKFHLSFNKLVFDKHIIYFFTNVTAYWDDLLSNKNLVSFEFSDSG